MFEIPLSKQNFCHLTHVDEYLLKVLFLHEDRIIFCVNSGNLQHSNSEWRPTKQSAIDLPPVDVFFGFRGIQSAFLGKMTICFVTLITFGNQHWVSHLGIIMIPEATSFIIFATVRPMMLKGGQA